MSGTRQHAPDQGVEGVFVLGAYASGGELVQALLERMGFRSLGAPGDGEGDDNPLVTLNDRLLEAAGGSREELPEVAPREVARMLARFADEARLRFRDPPHASGPDGAAAPWVWADPANSFLVPFWADALGARVAVVLVHRDPGDVVLSGTSLTLSDAELLDQWDRHNRAAIVQCSELPSMVLSYEELVAKPKETVSELTEFVEACGLSVAPDVEGAIELVDALSPQEGTRSGKPAVGAQYRTLARVLGQLDGIHAGHHATLDDNPGALLEAVSSFYGEDYYGTSYDQSGVPYRRDERLWVDFFARMASSIVATLGPGTALDMGCATGMLVEALRDRGVDARGIDVSTWAIDQVPEVLRPYCRVGSITDELDGHFDLITCFEVLEHLPPSLAAEAVANLCRHSDTVFFSSTPDDFDEPTHLNVESGGYWAQLFFRQGFVRDVDFDSSFLAPHAVVFRRRQDDVDEDTLIEDYERGLRNLTLSLGADLQEAVATSSRLAERNNALAPLARQAEHLREALDDVERRRWAESQASFDMVRQYEISERRLAALVNARDAEIDAIHRTKVFRYTALLRRIYGMIRRSRSRAAPSPAPFYPADGTYELWVEQFDTLDDTTRGSIRDRVAGLSHRPTITVIMPVYNPPPHLLRAAIDSVRGQLYTDWELCIADDCSSDSQVAEVLAEYEAMDTRIKVARRTTNGHISAASNTALSIATGEWVGCLDHDDILAEHALALAAAAIADHAGVGIVYSDEDKLDDGGHRNSPYFKPDFDPLLLIGQNYLSHLCLFRRDLVTQVGGYREGYEGSQDWDLTLRVWELLTREQVVHIPHVLYHWRAHAGSTASVLSAKPYAVDAGRRAAMDHLARSGRPGRIIPARIGRSGYNRVVWDPPDPEPLVSIVIPTRDGILLPKCIDSVLTMTTYQNFELMVVDNGSRSLAILAHLRANDDRVTVIRDERPFNYSAINNAAVQRTSGEIICLLNDDTEVMTEDWLTDMVSHVVQAGVGAVGAKLYYDNGLVQHGGVVLGINSVAAHSYRLFDRLSAGYSGRLQLAHHASAVTAACMVVRREAWDQVGGLDEHNLPIAFNDVDFCLRLRDAGWGVVWSPYAELYHHESISRERDDIGPRAAGFAREIEYMQKRWGNETLRSDPYYSPNLSLTTEDFSLAWPPRVSYR